MHVKIHESWKSRLKEEFDAPYFADLMNFVENEYRQGQVYPAAGQIFRAFEGCSFEAVRVLILGQDPYHGSGQANGLCFSVGDTVSLPPSLKNIFKELQSDLGGTLRLDGDLEDWARQGVFLLNATLTVRAGEAASHQGRGWERFTDAVVRRLAEEREGLVFILWGRYAQEKGELIDPARHLVLKSAHPSPLSAYSGFFGSKPFSQTDAYLQRHRQSPIRWV